MTYSQNVDEPTKVRLSGLRILPEGVFTLGDALEIGFSLENISGTRLTDYHMQFGYMQKGRFVPLFDVGRGACNMAHRSVKSFTHAVKAEGDAMESFVAAMKKKGERARNGFVVALTVTDNRCDEHCELFPVDLAVAIFDKRYKPVVAPEFGITRCDDGDMVAITARIGEEEAPENDLFSIRLYYAMGHEPSGDDACIELMDCAAALRDGVENDATMIDVSYDRAYDWFFKLVYGDEYEAASAVFILPQGFTNIHESGYGTGGVRFGGFSRSADGHPLFEVDYPAFFYGGIANIQAGVVPGVGMTGGGNCSDIPVKFPQPFAEGIVPVVVAGFQSSSTAGQFGRCSVSVVQDSVSNEGFTLRFHNGDTAGRDPSFTWIAFGIPAI